MDKSIEARNESYESILPGLLDKRQEVLMVLARRKDGMTAEDIASAMGIHAYRVRPRITELQKEGKVHVVGRRFNWTTGKNISVWAVAQ